MRGFDAFAGVIKSGGKNRRAAKMVVLNTPPRYCGLIECGKAKEEQKARALIEAGYDPVWLCPVGIRSGLLSRMRTTACAMTDEFMQRSKQVIKSGVQLPAPQAVLGRYRAR